MAVITINQEAWRELASSPSDAPVVMLNLLKFKGGEGKNSYRRYMKESSPFVAAVGAEVIFLGQPRELLTGTETWDLVMLVRYPSRRAFLKMATDPEYLKIHKYREEALERAVLYAMDETSARTVITGK